MFRLMIVDDEPIVRKGLQMLVNWEKMNCHVVYVAKNGRDAIDSIPGTSPDIIITDIKMPDVSGIEVAKYIHENGLPIKVIFLTAYADFSFAKLALDYGVVDYITKTGAFDGIEKAVERAKNMLIEERSLKKIESNESLTENFLKSLIDGSVYDKSDIKARASVARVDLKNYVSLVFHFSMDDKLTHERKTKINNSLINFFSMAFKEEKPFIIPVKRNIFCVVLNEVDSNYKKTIKDCCKDIIGILLNFMKLDVLIGVSSLSQDVYSMKKSYEEARIAISTATFSGQEEKLFFFKEENTQADTSPNIGKYEKATDDLCHSIKKGKTEEAMEKFAGIINFQQANKFSMKDIKDNGIYIISNCRRYLSKYDTDLNNILDYKQDIAKLVMEAFTISEYMGLMNNAISTVSAFINQSASKKDLLVYDCEKLIKASVEKNLNVTDISRKIGVSPSYLSRTYKEKTGSTIINAINMRKLDKAKDLLEKTDLRIYEIADELGFDNTTYFSHFFKKYADLSPLAYRKSMENSEIE